jgi:uncharacterized protein (TIGR03067 family)
MADSIALEECANCARAIGRLETPCIYKEQVVCAECYARLCPAMDCAPAAPADLERKQPNPISTAGQRIDKLIARGMQFGDAASKKVKDMADAAAPKLKAAGQTMTVKAKELGDKAAPALKPASAVVAEKSKGTGGAGKARDSGGLLRKGPLIYAGVVGAMVVLSIIIMSFTEIGGSSSGHPKSTSDLLQQIQGTWRQVGTESGGERTPAGDVGSSHITITGYSLHFVASMGGSEFAQDIPFTLDASHDPAWIDETVPGQGICPGIISIEGGTMRFYQAKPGSSRPQSFEDAKGDGDNVQVYQR